jgi:hypothetical protein
MTSHVATAKESEARGLELYDPEERASLTLWQIADRRCECGSTATVSVLKRAELSHTLSCATCANL